MKQHAARLFILMLLTILSSVFNPALAGTDPPVIQTLSGNLGQLKKDSFRTVQDDKFFDTSYNSKLIKPYTVHNRVSLRINENSAYFPQTAFSVTVGLMLYTTDANSMLDSSLISLNVSYNPSSAWTVSNASYVFSGAYRVKMKITDTASGLAWNVWNLLYLENELQSFPSFNFSCTANPVTSFSFPSLDPAGNEDELPVSWANIPNADQYDLEWCYIDSSALALNRYGSPLNPDSIFINNSSRATIAGTSYNIPLFYDGSGSLFFRVRPVQLQTGGGISAAAWSSDIGTSGLGRFDYKGHQRALNWQATTTFAEEGKRKTVVQYYDGSLRGRQTVTKDNSTLTTVVAETFYDYQGRPAVQVMPSPTISTIIQYSHNFNIDHTGSAYDKPDFDSLANPGLYCATGADSMRLDSGASRYYSPNNPEMNNGVSYNKFIPDAQRYPFTETQYTQDNTGRISRQGGVGPTYRIGGGRETVYYYGTPDQSQLDGLFGTEAGDHNHYFKTMVRDANGQYSVSYADMHGRTVATALAGSSPSVVDSLSYNIKNSITETIADSTTNTNKDLVMESKKSLLIATADTSTFTYSLSPQTLQLKGCDSSLVCYDCLYNLEITISDDCNNCKINPVTNVAFDTVLTKFSLGSSDSSCANPNGGFSFTFKKFLPEGNYEITKRLSISRAGSQYLRDSIYLKKNTCRSLATTISLQASLLAASDIQCAPTCQACTDSLGTYSAFYTRFMAKAGIANTDTASYAGLALLAYTQAQADCKALCDSTSQYDNILSDMLLDLTPNGQYANTDTVDKYSIFHSYISNVDGAHDTVANYQKVGLYLNDDGKPDSVYDETSGSMVVPQQLSPTAFSQKFKSSWANALLPYHPEYCKLMQYMLLSSSAQWDARFEATDSYDSAIKKGYLNPTDNTTNSNFTPFIASGTADYDPIRNFTGHSYTSDLESLILNYTNNAKYNYNSSHWVSQNISMWSLATASVKCGNKPLSCFVTYENNDSAFNGNMCPGDLDMAWRNFREYYLNVKQYLINQVLATSCPAPIPTTSFLIALGHQPHFSDALELTKAVGITYSTDTNAMKANAQDSINNFYNSNCSAYVTYWWQQLHNCYYTSSDSAIIIPELIQVCLQGSDLHHPYGSSSVSPSSTYQYKSFEDVISAYNTSHGITSSYCNAYGILTPKPYDQQSSSSNKSLYTKPDSCECSHITSLYDAYLAVSGNYTSFSNYMQVVYNTSIADSTLTLLRSLCSPAPVTCNFQKNPISLPPAMQCSTGDVCVNCNRITDLNNQFHQLYPGITAVSYPSATDSVQLAKNKLYENFMNYNLGFVKASADYLAFSNTCAGNTTTAKIATHDSLSLILKNFQTYGGTPHLDASDYDTTNWKLNFGGIYYDLGIPIGQVFANGVAQVPASYASTLSFATRDHIDFDHFYDTLCTGGNYTFEIRVKLPDSLVNHGGFYDANFWFWIYGDSTEAGTIQLGTSATIGTAIIQHDQDSRKSAPGALYQNTGFNIPFNNWRTLKLSFRGDTLKQYVDDTLVTQLLLTAPMTKVYGYTITQWAFQAAVDYVRIYDSASGTNYYYEQFNGGQQVARGLPNALCSCKTSFANYFNTQRSSHYSYTQVDSIYESYGITPAACGSSYDTSAITCTDLTNLQNEFRTTNLYPVAHYADLSMRTFAGNITPSTGPKGVFNVIGNLIGNTVDSTTSAVDSSFAQIWNTDSTDRNIGTLSALPNGLFRLTLNPGKSVPINGITGMRYYQFDSPADSIDAIICGSNSYINFGDGSQIKVQLYSDSSTHMYNNTAFGNGVLSNYTAPNYIVGRAFAVIHKFHTSGTKTLTVYHTDIKGILGFDCHGQYADNLMVLKNLRGYMPQQTISIEFHSTQDSTLNTTANIKNFTTVNSIESIDFENGSAVEPFAYFKNNRFGSFANNHHLKTVWISGGNSSDTSSLRPMAAFLPDSKNNFKELSTVVLNPIQGVYTNDFSFEVAGEDGGGLTGNTTPAQIDTILIQLARGSAVHNGALTFANNSSSRTSASDAAYDSLVARSWYLQGGGMNVINTYNYYSWSMDPDSLKYTDAFTDFVNQQLGTTMTWNQVNNLYQAKCGHFPIFGPDTSTGPTLCGRAAPSLPAVAINAVTDCIDSSFYAVSGGTEIYNGYVDSLNNIFDSVYRAKCLNAYKFESFTVTHHQSEYHYTLYYYDQAGNLVKTVPPAGVNANFNKTFTDSVENAKALNQIKIPTHSLYTQYRYNTLNQVIAQNTPDATLSHFWYDRLGRLAISQNAKQKAVSGTETNRQYSYTLYDQLGRITEVGQIANAGSVAMTDSISRKDTLLNAWLLTSANNKQQITQTVYDIPYSGFSGYSPLPLVQRNMRNRVSYTSYTLGKNPASYNQATFFTYDIEGNVDTLIQDYGNASIPALQNVMNENQNRIKQIVYDYDLISGKVNKVSYQRHYDDQFYHVYTYDAENRLINVQTSKDSAYWETDARYYYYKHGPLARMVIGDLQVQGLDYAYTLQGWLKGVNSMSLKTNYDMGNDGDTSSLNLNKYVGADVFSYGLNYYSGDYSAISGLTPFPGVQTGLTTLATSNYRALYNGNISSMGVNIGVFYLGTTNDPPNSSSYALPMLYNYTYDQLNRITGMKAFYGLNQTTNSWNSLTFTPDYKEKVQYDLNGNIKKYTRYDHNLTLGSEKPMDSLTYNYNSGTNQLNYIKDSALAGTTTYDLKTQPVNNYGYDAIGNIIKDSIEKINNIVWNVYGKITEIDHSGTTSYNTVRNISYGYDASGNRISKRITTQGTKNVKYVWYVRDASGNVMCSYSTTGDSTVALNTLGMGVDEMYLYGSSRLGMVNPATDVHTDSVDHIGYYSPWNGMTVSFQRGQKSYELSNHLGNVLETVSDNKPAVVQSGNSSLVDHYNAKINTAQDYYPFGMLMQGRTVILTGVNYRYGFNKQENDDEVKGESNMMGAEFWEYDSRSGRRWNIEPKPNSGWSPYATFGNSPIWRTDAKGDTAIVNVNPNVQLRYVKDNWVNQQTRQTVSATEISDPCNVNYNKNAASLMSDYSALNKVDGYEPVTNLLNSAPNNVFLDRDGNATSTDDLSYLNDRLNKGIAHPDVNVHILSNIPSENSNEFENGDGNISSFMALGHELGHAWDLLTNGKSLDNFKQLPNLTAGISASEKNAMYWENIVRAKFTPNNLRTGYYYNENTSKLEMPSNIQTEILISHLPDGPRPILIRQNITLSNLDNSQIFNFNR